MSTYIVQEGEWDSFITKHIVPVYEKQDTRKGARVLALVGDLGAGKTTFSKHLLKHLGVSEHVQSPTFSIINSYSIHTGRYTKVFHVDVYRIEDHAELEVLKFAELFVHPKHLVVIEWADTIKELVPQDAVWITFEHDTIETRKVTINKGTQSGLSG